MFEWDENKAAENFRKHAVSFEQIVGFDFTTAMIEVDNRRAYGEERLVALGLIGFRVYCACYTMRGENKRVISLRKANDREIRKYVEYTEA